MIHACFTETMIIGRKDNLIGSMYGIFTYIIWLIFLMVNIGKHIMEVLYNSICQLLAFKDLFVRSVDGHGFYFFMEPHHQSVVQYRFVVSFFFVVKNVMNSPARCCLLCTNHSRLQSLGLWGRIIFFGIQSVKISLTPKSDTGKGKKVDLGISPGNPNSGTPFP